MGSQDEIHLTGCVRRVTRSDQSLSALGATISVNNGLAAFFQGPAGAAGTISHCLVCC